jgi:hypothetical protein
VRFGTGRAPDLARQELMCSCARGCRGVEVWRCGCGGVFALERGFAASLSIHESKGERQLARPHGNLYS